MAEAASNRLNAPSRPPWWMVTYDLDPNFFNLNSATQYQKETADATDAVDLDLEREWKVAYTTTDFKKGWILLKVASQDEAETVIKNYKMYQFFQNLTYTAVYSATQSGINLGIIWDGVKLYVKQHLKF